MVYCGSKDTTSHKMSIFKRAFNDFMRDIDKYWHKLNRQQKLRTSTLHLDLGTSKRSIPQKFTEILLLKFFSS